MHDAIVVGASAVGANAARHLAKNGVETLVLEEHSKPGKFGKCSGLVSKKGLDEIGVDYSCAKLNSVKGATFFCANQEFTVSSSCVKAIVLDRQAYDEQCVKSASDAGAKFSYSSSATAFFQSNCVKTRVGKNLIDSRALVGADGVSSTVANAFGFPPIPRKNLILAYEAQFSKANSIDENKVQLFFEKEFGGFFAWTIPCSNNCVRAGFGVTDYALLEEGKKKLFSIPLIAQQLAGAEKSSEFSHFIPLSCRKQTQQGNVLLCGDSAGQVKATTGGGIVFGSLCAKIAAKEISSFIHEQKPISYETKWRKKYGKTLYTHGILRSTFNKLDENLIKGLMKVSKAFGAQKLFSCFGDMDFIFSI